MGNISNYVRVLKAKLQDVFVVDSTDNNVTTTKSVTVEQIGDAICGEQVHATLETDDKTIIGGINENKDKVGDLSQLTTTDKSSLVGAVNEVNKGLVKSVFLTTTYNCSYSDANTIGYRGTGPDITTLTGYPTGKNILAVVIERSYVDNKIYPAITSLDTNTLYTESKNSGTAYIGMRVLYTD